MEFDWLTICGVLVAGVLSIIGLLILHARWNYGVLENLGIPVVKPHFILGSLFLTRFEPIGYRDVALMKEYGPMFGVSSERISWNSLFSFSENYRFTMAENQRSTFAILKYYASLWSRILVILMPKFHLILVTPS